MWTVYLRLALAAGFLTAVTDRFGLWGPPGTANVAWGEFNQFAAYTGRLNPWAPTALIWPLAWLVTGAEIVVGVVLTAGVATRQAALAGGVLLGLFALGMTMGTGLKSALNASVFAASAGALALAMARSYPWSIDAWLASTARHSAAARSADKPDRRSVDAA
jgi:uncharacterized membrane protein YphA (DoxX/SURF4 family)